MRWGASNVVGYNLLADNELALLVSINGYMSVCVGKGALSLREWSRTTLYFIWQSVGLDSSHKEDLMDGGTEEEDDDALN